MVEVQKDWLNKKDSVIDVTKDVSDVDFVEVLIKEFVDGVDVRYLGECVRLWAELNFRYVLKDRLFIEVVKGSKRLVVKPSLYEVIKVTETLINYLKLTVWEVREKLAERLKELKNEVEEKLKSLEEPQEIYTDSKEAALSLTEEFVKNLSSKLNEINVLTKEINEIDDALITSINVRKLFEVIMRLPPI